MNTHSGWQEMTPVEGCELRCLAQQLSSLLACWSHTTMVSGKLHLRLPTLVCLAQVGHAQTVQKELLVAGTARVAHRGSVPSSINVF